MAPHEFPLTIAALRSLGETLTERAAAMRVSERAMSSWLNGNIPFKRLQRWARNEAVWNALRLDLLVLPETDE